MLIHLFCFLFIAAAPQTPAATPRVLASSTDWSITTEDFARIVQTFPPDDRARYSVTEYRNGLLNELVRIWVLTTEARKNGAEVGEDYESRKNYYQKYARDVGARITEEAVRKYYDDHLDDFTQVRLSHILILNGNSPVTPHPGLERLPYEKAEQKAKEVKAMLDQGADWDQVSKDYSQAIDVKDHGGDIGFISKGQVEKSIEDAAYALKPGQLSDVVGSVFGFHILRVTDRKVVPFEQLRQSILQKLTSDEVNRLLDAKVKAAGITIDPTQF
jgi:peptidyl-prolyl cis-trans isomerase C